MAHVTARISDDLQKQMQAIADKQDRSFSQVAGYAFAEYVEKYGVKKPVKKKATIVQK